MINDFDKVHAGLLAFQMGIVRWLVCVCVFVVFFAALHKLCCYTWNLPFNLNPFHFYLELPWLKLLNKLSKNTKCFKYGFKMNSPDMK